MQVLVDLAVRMRGLQTTTCLGGLDVSVWCELCSLFQGRRGRLRDPSRDVLAKILNTKSIRLTVSCRVIWACSERVDP